eukprot:TRINITY_DN6281_c0_g2_i1.p1 TRINITY_DN6281_c0_g2~~TRINITY_DN6281_c0_g2_i1.p1  ORF type:complete len:579 (+),score=165.46 TRINITY_DN6281_c0_g2_i1:57-1739(+)
MPVSRAQPHAQPPRVRARPVPAGHRRTAARPAAPAAAPAAALAAGRCVPPARRRQTADAPELSVTGQSVGSVEAAAPLRQSGILFSSATLRDAVGGRWHGAAYECFVRKGMKFPAASWGTSECGDGSGSEAATPLRPKLSAVAVAAAAVAAQRAANGQAPAPAPVRSAPLAPPPEPSDSPPRRRTTTDPPLAALGLLPSVGSSTEVSAAVARVQLQAERQRWMAKETAAAPERRADPTTAGPAAAAQHVDPTTAGPAPAQHADPTAEGPAMPAQHADPIAGMAGTAPWGGADVEDCDAVLIDSSWAAESAAESEPGPVTQQPPEPSPPVRPSALCHSPPPACISPPRSPPAPRSRPPPASPRGDGTRAPTPPPSPAESPRAATPPPPPPAVSPRPASAAGSHCGAALGQVVDGLTQVLASLASPSEGGLRRSCETQRAASSLRESVAPRLEAAEPGDAELAAVLAWVRSSADQLLSTLPPQPALAAAVHSQASVQTADAEHSALTAADLDDTVSRMEARVCGRIEERMAATVQVQLAQQMGVMQDIRRLLAGRERPLGPI